MAKQEQSLVLAAFADVNAAQEALERVKNWDEADEGVKAGAIGVIAKDANGQINEKLLGGRAGGKGAKVGVILGLIAAIPTGGLSLLGGVIGGGVGGGVLGHFVHRNYSLTEADIARIHSALDAGKAFVGVLVPAAQAGAFEDQLKRFGGDTELHEVTEEGEQKAAEAAAPVSDSQSAVAEKVKRAAQVFLYGYPLVYNLTEIGKFPHGSPLLKDPVQNNTFGYARELLDPSAKFVTPNNDTLYLFAVCDLRNGPLVLRVPATQDRYYVLQCVDAWTNNFAYIGRRATGTAAGEYLIVPPDYTGEAPDTMQAVHAPSAICIIVGRITVNGVDDLPTVHALQDQFTVTPLSVVQGGPAPAQSSGIPEPDPRVPDSLKWWEQFRVALAAFPPPAADAPFLAMCDEFGLTAAESPYVSADPQLAQVLVAAEKAAHEKIEELMQHLSKTPNGWQDSMHSFDYNLDYFEVGTLNDPAWKIEDRTNAYVIRAVVARAGLWGNHGYEADYQIIFVDSDGQPLVSANRYELVLTEPPPVDAFWSLTMYDVPEFYLVENPINRYSIGDRTPGLKKGADGSLTLYLQKDSPGPDKESNWLPAPQDGRFRPVMRLYQPGKAVLDGSYQLPPIRRVE